MSQVVVCDLMLIGLNFRGCSQTFLICWREKNYLSTPDFIFKNQKLLRKLNEEESFNIVIIILFFFFFRKMLWPYLL